MTIIQIFDLIIHRISPRNTNIMCKHQSGDKYFKLIFIASELKLFFLTLATAKDFLCDSQITRKTNKDGFASMEYPKSDPKTLQIRQE